MPVLNYWTIEQQRWSLMGLTPWQPRRRVAHAWRDTYTGPDDTMFCAKPKVYDQGWEPSYATFLLWLCYKHDTAAAVVVMWIIYVTE